MQQELIQNFLIKNGECFDSAQLVQIKSQLETIDDSKAGIVLGQSYQSPTVMLIIAILLGWERLFLDDIALGIIKIITCYGLMIWWLVDIISAKRRTYEYNYKKFVNAVTMCR